MGIGEAWYTCSDFEGYKYHIRMLFKGAVGFTTGSMKLNYFGEGNGAGKYMGMFITTTAGIGGNYLIVKKQGGFKTDYLSAGGINVGVSFGAGKVKLWIEPVPLYGQMHLRQKNDSEILTPSAPPFEAEEVNQFYPEIYLEQYILSRNEFAEDR